VPKSAHAYLEKRHLQWTPFYAIDSRCEILQVAEGRIQASVREGEEEWLPGAVVRISVAEIRKWYKDPNEDRT
jgi:hypothetical protein